MAGMSGEQIFENFETGQGTRPLQQIADELQKLTKTYGARAQSISDLNTQMKSAWTGDASAAAHSGAAALMPALEDSAKKMDHTNGATQNQAVTWERASNAVEPVPPMPEKPNPWTTGLKAAIPVAGPFMAADDINTYQEGAQAHQRVAQHNVDVMNSYTGQTGGNSDFPRTYSVMQPSGGSISLSDGSGPGGISGDQSLAPDTTRASSTFTPHAASVASGGPVSAVPQVNAPVSSGSVITPTTGGSSGTMSPPPPVGGGGGTGGGGTGGGATTGGGLIGAPGGRDSNRDGSGRTGSNTSRTTGFNRSTNGPGRGLAGDRLRGVPDPKETTGRGGTGGRGGTIGRGGIGQGGAGRAGVGDAAGRGAAGESARGLGAGKGTGTAMPGAAAAAESAAGRGAAAAGGRGMGTTPMGAAGAGRARRDEDEEHQRPAYLQENDPDEVFIGDLGKTAPPVIGE